MMSLCSIRPLKIEGVSVGDIFLGQKVVSIHLDAEKEVIKIAGESFNFYVPSRQYIAVEDRSMKGVTIG